MPSTAQHRTLRALLCVAHCSKCCAQYCAHCCQALCQVCYPVLQSWCILQHRSYQTADPSPSIVFQCYLASGTTVCTDANAHDANMGLQRELGYFDWQYRGKVQHHDVYTRPCKYLRTCLYSVHVVYIMAPGQAKANSAFWYIGPSVGPP